MNTQSKQKSKRDQLKSLLHNIKSDPEIRKHKELVGMIDNLITDLETNEYRITVVGEFSSGKSTFLNSIMGVDVLPHGVEETTAAITYIHNVSTGDAKENKVEVFFRDDTREPIVLDLSKSKSALKDYVTAKSNIDVVKDVAEVHLYIHYMNDDKKVVLIDTPGLNGMKPGMRDITYRELNRSHANICLFNFKGVSQTDIDFIRKYYESGTPFFFVLNQIDKLNEETPEERIQNFTESLSKEILKLKDSANLSDKVFGISSLLALSARDKSIEKVYENSNAISDDDRPRLLEESRMKDFEKALFGFIESGEIEQDYLGKTKNRLIDILELEKEDAQREIDILTSKVENCPEKEILEKQKKNVLNSIEKNKTIIANKLGSAMDTLQKEAIKEVRKNCDSTSEQARKKVENWNTIEIAERESRNGTIVAFINSNAAYHRNDLQKWLVPRFDNIYSTMVDIVKSFVPNVQFSKKSSSWNFSFNKETVSNTSSKLDKYNQELKNLEMEIATERKGITGLQNQDAEDKRRIRVLQNEKSQKEGEHRLEMRKLGDRPMPRSWTVERKVKKRFLFIIPYTSTESYIENNDYEISQYDRKKAEIEQKYSCISSYDKTLRNLYGKSASTASEIRQKEALIKKMQDQKESLQIRRKKELEEIEMKKIYSRQKYLSSLKQQAFDKISSSITPDEGELYLALREDVRRNISTAESSMKKNLEELYLQIQKRFIDNLNIFIQKIEKSADTQGMKQRVASLSTLTKAISRQLSIIETV